MKNILVGITGGIGSGKSIVSTVISSKGFPVIKSDDLAKELMTGDKNIQKNILEAFGPESFIEGKLNTKYIAQLVFSDEANLLKINNIVHPPTIDKIKELAKKYHQTKPIVFVESALIFEAEFDNIFDYLVLVYSEESLRIKRTLERDNSNEEEVKKRISFQIPDENKKDSVDFVLENNSTKQKLEEKTQFVLMLLQQMSK